MKGTGKVTPQEQVRRVTDPDAMQTSLSKSRSHQDIQSQGNNGSESRSGGGRRRRNALEGKEGQVGQYLQSQRDKDLFGNSRSQMSIQQEQESKDSFLSDGNVNDVSHKIDAHDMIEAKKEEVRLFQAKNQMESQDIVSESDSFESQYSDESGETFSKGSSMVNSSDQVSDSEEEDESKNKSVAPLRVYDARFKIPA